MPDSFTASEKEITATEFGATTGVLFDADKLAGNRITEKYDVDKIRLLAYNASSHKTQVPSDFPELFIG